MKKSMLIVDDSEADRYIIKRFTEKSGLFDHIYSLNDGEDAYEHFKNYERSKEEKGEYFPPAVIILDINMPRMNGFEFLEKFNALPDQKSYNILFVAMLTSSRDQAEKDRAMKYPFVELFLSKPFKREYVELLSQKVDEKMAKINE